MHNVNSETINCALHSLISEHVHLPNSGVDHGQPTWNSCNFKSTNLHHNKLLNLRRIFSAGLQWHKLQDHVHPQSWAWSIPQFIG